jgi:methyltransferase (TIGR00027 family)
MPEEEVISKTAVWVAAARAIGAREPDPAVRNPDRLAEALLGDPALLEPDIPIVEFLGASYANAMQEIEVAGTVRAMAERTRFIDQALERAVANGISQCLILGAGFDSRAYRCTELLARAQVYEVDRPRTSAFKQGRVAAALGGPPANLTYVAVDLAREALPAALARHGYDLSRRTFVIMEGLTMYVQEQPLRDTFGFLAAHAPGSSIAFDFATRAMVEGLGKIDLTKVPPANRPPIERFMNMIRHEPWVFGIALDGEQEFLAGLGLQLREMLTIGSEESVRRHLTRADGTTLGAEAHAKTEALRRLVQERMLASMDAAQREQAEAAMREQARQNAYRIAEAVVGS